MKKNNHLIVVSLLFISLFIHNFMYGQNKINKIEISYVHWGITTFCLVDCNEFDKAFNIDNIKKNYIISDSLIIASIDRKISKIMQHKKIIDDVAVDTRLKMRFYSDEKLIRTICIGTISIQINGAVYSGVYDTDPEVEELRDLLDKVSALYTFLKQEKY